jgi:hypothetical protein
MLKLFMDNFWPLKQFLNYIFKKTLGDYILNDLNLEELEVGIKNNYSITLTNLKLNAYEINRKHLKNSPLKMLDGFIKKFDLILDKENLQIKIKDVHILLMPVFNVDKLNTATNTKKDDHNNTSNSTTNESVENSLIAGIINSALSNLEVSITNISVKILSYEVNSNDQDNPTFSIFLSKIEYNKQNTNLVQIDNNSEEKVEKSFFYGKRLLLDKFCIRLSKYYVDDVDAFFAISNTDDDRSLFNFFCDNSCIFAAKYDEDLPFCAINFNENGFESLKLDAKVNRLELFINPLQLQLIINFFDVCNKIFISNNPVTRKLKKRELVTPLKILNSRIVNMDVSVSFEMVNIILIENSYNKEMPKLWSFYETNYSRNIKTIENLESHFSYLEDNYFILNITDIRVKLTTNMADFSKITEIQGGTVCFKFIEYLNKFPKKTKEILKFNNSSINASKYSIANSSMSRGDSFYQSVAEFSETSQTGNLSMYKSATEEDLMLINNYNRLLEFDYFYNSYMIVTIKAASVSEKFGFTAKILNTMASDNVTNYMKVSIGDIKVDFNIMLLFKINRIIFDNIVIINEIIYYFNNSNGENNNNATKDIKLENNEEDKNISNNEDNPKFSKSFDEGDSLVSNNSYKQIASSKLNDIKYEWFSFVIDIEDIEIKVSSLTQESKPFKNTFFEEYYHKHINPLYIKDNWQSQKIYQEKDHPIDNFKSTELITIILNKTRLISLNETRDNLQQSEHRIDLSQLLIYFKEDLLVNFKNAEDARPSRTFTTGNEVKRSRMSSTDLKSYLLKEFEGIFNPTKLKQKSWICTILSKREYEINNFNYNDEVREYQLKSMGADNFLIDPDLNNSGIEPDCCEFKRNLISLNLTEHINIHIGYKNVYKLLNFIDMLGYAVNIFTIFAKNQKMINNKLKKLIAQNYKFENFHEQNLNTTTNVNLISRLSFNSIDLGINKINICLIEETSLGTNILLKFNIGKVRLCNNICNGENNLLVSICDLQATVNRNKFILYTIEEAVNSSFFRIYIKLKDHEFSEPVLLVGEIYLNNLEEIEKKNLLKQTCFEDFIEFLNKNKLKQNDIDGVLDLKLSNIVLSPLYNDFNIDEIHDLITKLKNNDKVNTCLDLIEPRKVNLDLKLSLSTFVIDIMYTHGQEKAKWIRSLLAIDNITLSRTLTECSLTVEKVQVLLLKDLSLDISSDLLTYNYLKTINQEISQLKFIGFVEIFNIDYMCLKYSLSKLTMNTSVEVKSIEINLCKDSYLTTKALVDIVKETINEIKMNFKVEKQSINNNNIEIIEEVEDESSKGLTVIDDYLGLDNSMEGGQSSISRKSSNRKRSSIDTNIIIVDNKKPEMKSILTIKLASFKIYLFKGKDFSFSENGKNYSFKNHVIEDSKEFKLVEDYFFKFIKNDNFISSDFRPRAKRRDYNNYICLDLQKLYLGVKIYKDSDKVLNIKLNLDRLDINDYVKKSKYKKMLSKYDYENEAPFIHVKVKMNKSSAVSDKRTKDKEIISVVKILPINVLIDQYSIFLLMDFFDISLTDSKNKQDKELISLNNNNNSYLNSSGNESFKNLSESNNEKRRAYSIINKSNENLNCSELSNLSSSNNDKDANKMTYIRKFKIDEFFINFCYNSHELVLSKIKKSNFMELINISNIKDLRIFLKSYEFSGYKTIHEILEIILTYWRNDISGQLISPHTLTSISTIRPLVNMFNGFMDIFKQPWEYYKTDKSIKDGLTIGVRNFVLNFTTESLFLGEKVK